GQLTVGEQGDDPGREPERRRPCLLAEVVLHEAVEEVGGGDDRQHPDHLWAEQRRGGREQQGVVERVVAAVPAAVPERQAGVLEELGMEDLGGEIADPWVPDQHQGRQDRAERDRRQPFGAEWLRLDHALIHSIWAHPETILYVSAPLLLLRAGTVPYRAAWDMQLRLAGRRGAGEIPDVLMLLEHPPVYSRGRRTKPEELPMGASWYEAQGIEVLDTDRGGLVTYHGPGQLVAYPIVDLGPLGDDVHEYVRGLERVMIGSLAEHGVGAQT